MSYNSLQFGDLITYNSQTHGDSTVVVVTAVNHHAGLIYGILRTSDGIEEQRIIPMSNESIVIQKVFDSGYSSRLSSTENSLLSSINSRKYAPLLQNLLNDSSNHNEYLLPSRIKQCKNRAFGFPARIEQTGRIRVPMWIMQDDGKIDVAYVYLSNSDGRFHITPGFDGAINRLIKGDNFGLSYVTTNRLDPEIEQYIHTLYGGTEIPSSFPKRVRGFTGNLLAKNDSISGIEKYQYIDFGKSVQKWIGSEVFRILGFHEDMMKPSRWHKIPNLTPQDILKILYSHDNIFRSLIDFSKKDSSYNHKHSNKGVYQVQVFSSYIAGSLIEWHIGEKGEDVWLDNIFVRVQNPLNAYGVHRYSVDAGGLISKPWEYKIQVGQVLMNDPHANTLLKDINDEDYISVEPFLDHNPVVRLYREYKSQSRTPRVA